jgi:cation diffusion facilitator CzcD-associated flavoprotein CzcO
MTYCVVGAGAAGLAAAHHLKAAGIPFEVLERERDVGGIWDVSLPHSPVYRSTHLISSKPLTSGSGRRSREPSGMPRASGG